MFCCRSFGTRVQHIRVGLYNVGAARGFRMSMAYADPQNHTCISFFSGTILIEILSHGPGLCRCSASKQTNAIIINFFFHFLLRLNRFIRFNLKGSHTKSMIRFLLCWLWLRVYCVDSHRRRTHNSPLISCSNFSAFFISFGIAYCVSSLDSGRTHTHSRMILTNDMAWCTNTIFSEIWD